MSDRLLNELIGFAYEQNKAYPQYNGVFDNYVLVQIKKEQKTKLGLAFRWLEYAIASPELRESNGKTFRTVYSFRNRANTSINEKHVELV